MRKFLISACTIIAAGLAVAQVGNMVRNVNAKPELGTRTVAKVAQKKAARARINFNESGNASFTVLGANAQQTVWSENFDAGSEGWTFTPDADNYITIKLKQMTGSQAFTSIDAGDTQSLFMEGPYQVYRRSIGWATSPDITVPTNGVFHAYIGYSATFNQYAGLTITASTDDFATETEVWNSTQGDGVNTWHWHSLEIPMYDFAGKTIKLRFTYGPGTNDNFKSGGYMADFAIDGLSITAPSEVNGIELKTGETATFVDMSTGDIKSREWKFEGGTPETSTELNPTVFWTRDGEYNVTLTVTDAQGNKSTATRDAFVKVTGEAPVAHILPPATFHDCDTYLPFIAPLAPVQYQDASTGFPEQYKWTFTGTTPATSTEANPWVSYDFQNNQKVQLEVSNQHGTSQDTMSVTVGYQNYICNQLATDYPVTYDLEGSGTFPGSNRMKINAYAEHFSKPSAPMMVYGALVFFETAQAENISDQIANIGVHLYTAKDGKPDKKVDSFWWRVVDVDVSTSTTMRGTWFEFGPHVVKDEFFVVVDGLPESNDSCNVSFAMSNLRNENTAYMQLRDEWRPVSGFFNEKGTSFYIWPGVAHSVLTLLPVGTEEIKVPAEGGTIEQQIFSMFGYDNPAANDGDWAKIISTPNELTLDTLKIECEPLPEGLNRRVQVFNITDRIEGTTISFKMVQERESGLEGDVNGDGVVDITDVNIVINIMLGKDDAANYDGRADLNADGIIDITDVNQVINKMLGK